MIGVGRTGQRVAIAAVASGAIVSVGLVANAQASDDKSGCREAIRVAEQMTEVNGRRIGTMAARSAALRLAWDEKVEELTPKHLALVAEYESLHLEFQAAAASC